VTTSGLMLRVEQLCLDLVGSGKHITFTTVAARTGLSRSTLYRHVELRALIQEQRVHARHVLTLSGLAVEGDQLRQGLEAVAARTPHHEELLRRSNRSASA
jgi:hypothetical protein